MMVGTGVSGEAPETTRGLSLARCPPHVRSHFPALASTMQAGTPHHGVEHACVSLPHALTVSLRGRARDRMAGKRPSATQPQPPWPQTPGKSRLHWSHSDLCRWDLLLPVLTKPMFGIFFFLRAQRHSSFVTRGSCWGARPLRPRAGGSGCSLLGCIARWATLASSGVGLGAGLGGCAGAGSGAAGGGGQLGRPNPHCLGKTRFPNSTTFSFLCEKESKGLVTSDFYKLKT